MLGDYVFSGEETIYAMIRTMDAPIVFNISQKILTVGPFPGNDNIVTHGIKTWSLARNAIHFDDTVFHTLYVHTVAGMEYLWDLPDKDFIILGKNKSQVGTLYVGL